MTFSLQPGGVASAQGPKTSRGCPQIHKGCLFFTKGDTEHSVTWHHYLDQGCVPVETRRFWGSGNGCLPLNGRSALCLMEPGRGQPLASMSFLSLCTFPSWVWGRQSRLQLVGWEWEVASYFGKMQREMAGQER